LSVGLNGTSSISVDSGEVLVGALAAEEGSVDVGSRSVVLASNTVKYVLTEMGSVGTGGVASLEAERSSTHEVVPFYSLDELSVEGVGEQETTEGVTTLIGTVGVQLSSGVVGLDVDVLLLDEASDLNVVGRLHELNAGDGTLGDDTGTIAWLRAPSNALTLGVADERILLGRAPEAEVIDAVDDGSLAQRGWSLSSGVAQVVTELGTTLTSISVGLVRESTPGKVLRGERNALGKDGGDETRSECDSSEHGMHFVD
jgi:hypothetical protein